MKRVRGLVVGLFDTGGWAITLAYVFVGAGVGLFIGTLTGAVEGAVVKRSAAQARRAAALGGGAGLVSGIVGLLIGEFAFLTLKGGLLGRAAGWTALGLFQDRERAGRMREELGELMRPLMQPGASGRVAAMIAEMMSSED